MEQSVKQGEQPLSTWSPALEALRVLKDHRDGFLVLGALVYALGFLTWAIHSWRVGIGFIDAFKAQYILAGLWPSILILLTLNYIALAQYQFIKLSGVYWRGGAVVFCFIFAIMHVLHALAEVLGGSVFHFPVDALGPITLESSGMVLVLWRISMYTVYLFFSSTMFLYIFYLILSVNILHWLRISAVSRFSVGVAWGVVIVFLLLSTMVYVVKVFPRLPPEIGGGQERCARLDVRLDKLSQESAGILIDQAKVPATAAFPSLVQNEIRHYAKSTEKKMNKEGKKDEKAEETVTTREIYVVYISDKSLFFSLPKSTGDARKYEVSREAISLISWCVRSDPA